MKRSTKLIVMSSVLLLVMPRLFHTWWLKRLRRIEMDETLRVAAKKSLDRMLEMASGTVGKGDLGGRG